MSKPIVITGISGFTGKYVREKFLENGDNVVGLDHLPLSTEPNYVNCDITNKQALVRAIKEIKPRGVIHLAGISFLGHTPESDFYNVNVIGTCNLLDAIAELPYKIEKLIVASSANVYGSSTNKAISETSSCNPVSHYAVSKLAMEFMVNSYSHIIPTVIVRPFNYIGRGQSPNFLIPKLVSHFKNREKKIDLGNIDVSRDFLDVRDVSQIYFELYRSGIHSEILNICSGRVISVNKIIELLTDICGYKIKIFSDNSLIRKYEIKTMKGDNKKLTTLLGYEPRFSIKDTLEDMLR